MVPSDIYILHLNATKKVNHHIAALPHNPAY
ncbi:hypothetical protein PPTG_21558 [Phytophthora nicotianae INRA-310]|uniref:Uncharacterized protein n=2 Tax=Phytophthora nicotianae TaxID=4792 RepID=W2QZ46_PHYN3|nr:hypothetical protein PPTG_21558 [Phytophthora nicotianae INRA-310]ETI36176.1 hypothetical protein F443_17650 [Phytophthora nicotianae P1569]ETN18477.1 hypothetical protein PPTG_21558 [Phytophthora nicotianae INRA-310]